MPKCLGVMKDNNVLSITSAYSWFFKTSNPLLTVLSKYVSRIQNCNYRIFRPITRALSIQ